jgi:hypothetical protein
MPTFWQDDTRKDPLAVADSFATDWYTYPVVTDRFATFRLGHINSVNSPYGNGNTDFFYHLYKLTDSNWIRLVAYDVRSDNIYTITKTDGHWGIWHYIPFGDVAYGVATLDSNYVNNGTIEWYKAGRIVTINITNLQLKSWSDGDKRIGYGLPPSQFISTKFSIPPLNGSTPAQLISINTDGTIDGNGGMSHVGYFYGSFTYIASS